MPDDPAQSKRFIEAAKEVEAGDDAKTFDKAFKKVAGAALPAKTTRR